MTKKHPGGRPSKYKPEHAEALIKFFSGAKFERVLKSKIKGFGKAGNQNFDKEEYERVPNELPTFAKFARSIKVNKDTVIEWASAERPDGTKKYPEFSDAYNAAKELQKEFLVDNGLAGLYPPASFIFTAKNITNMRDKVETENRTDVHLTGFEKLSDDQLDAVIKSLQNSVRQGVSGADEASSAQSA